mgnify:CR=1 FL=1
MTRILVLGAEGQIGSEIVRALSTEDAFEVLPATRDGRFFGASCLAIDLARIHELNRVLTGIRPDVIVNAAAYTHVDNAEREPSLVYQVNGEAPGQLANYCRDAGSALVHFSTDYVFDGRARTPYQTDSVTNPLNVYGRSKLAGEREIAATGCNFLILRTAWVYSHFRRNFLTTMLNLAQTRDEVAVVDDQIGSPTPALYVATVTKKLLTAGINGQSIEQVVTSGAESWAGFAEAIFDELKQHRLIVSKPRVERISSEAYKTAAVRPAYSVLDNGGLRKRDIEVPHWRDELANFFRQRALEIGTQQK